MQSVSSATWSGRPLSTSGDPAVARTPRCSSFTPKAASGIDPPNAQKLGTADGTLGIHFCYCCRSLALAALADSRGEVTGSAHLLRFCNAKQESKRFEIAVKGWHCRSRVAIIRLLHKVRLARSTGRK